MDGQVAASLVISIVALLTAGFAVASVPASAPSPGYDEVLGIESAQQIHGELSAETVETKLDTAGSITDLVVLLGAEAFARRCGGVDQVDWTRRTNSSWSTAALADLPDDRKYTAFDPDGTSTTNIESATDITFSCTDGSASATVTVIGEEIVGLSQVFEATGYFD